MTWRWPRATPVANAPKRVDFPVPFDPCSAASVTLDPKSRTPPWHCRRRLWLAAHLVTMPLAIYVPVGLSP
ncbi:hypothetical protein CBM2613_A250111 [Cupriavidus taiwanensis]|uniref:Uncharacterized protein n=1 Tax=Cupriavidus taiwanensis TaxID=164546 RepID=A0A375E0D7_9BURK|nr:hypothetical protein CBM2613_A250111 [Cupriavidus taiwanensis]